MALFRTPDRFPGLDRLGPDGRPFVHADAAGGSLVPVMVGTAMAEALLFANCNPNRPHALSREVARHLDQAREAFGRFADADPQGVVFGPSATALTWHFARTFEGCVRAGDEIVCTRLDHEANVSPWLALAERRQARVRFVDLDVETWQPNLRTLEASVNDRTRLIAFTRASNLTGSVVDPGPFVAAARAVGAITYADGVHLAAHLPLRQRELGIDVQVCSPYKFFGPHMGVLSAPANLLEELEPDRVRPSPALGPRRWEPGMLSVEAVAGLQAAVRYITRAGYDEIARYEHELTVRALERLAGLPGVRLHGRRTPTERTPTFAITVAGRRPQEVAAELGRHGVLVSAGTNYAIETVRVLGLEPDGAVRIAFAHYHTLDDVDRACDALSSVVSDAPLSGVP